MKIKLTNIGKQEFFATVMEKMTLNIELNQEESEYILACAILFLKEYEKDNSHYQDGSYDST